MRGMADPRSLFGERRLPERLGGRQVDRYIPPEIRQGIGGFLAGIEMLNPVTAYRDYMSAARRGDYPEAAVNLAGFVAPGVASGLASRAIRPVVRAARGAVSSADEGARALMEMLSPVGAVDDLAARGYGEGLGDDTVLDTDFSELESALSDPRFFEPEPEVLAPPPAAIDIFEQVPFNPRADDPYLLRELHLGEFDDFLPQSTLFENFRILRSLNEDGRLTVQALVADGFTPNEANVVINRYRGLQQRFEPPEEGLLVTDRASDLDRLRDLRRLPEALTDEATLDLMDLRIRHDLGEFDDLLTESDLLENFRELRSMEADGLLTAQALMGHGLTPNQADTIINRYRSLEQRFGQPEEGLLDISDLDLDEDFVPAQVPPTLVPVPTQASTRSLPVSAGETLLYSRAANAAQQLKQPVYTDPDQVRRELEARGAPGRELDLIGRQLDDLFQRSNTGRVEASAIRELLDAAPRLEFNRSGEFASYSVPGGTNYRATFVTHPSVRAGPDAATNHFGRRKSPPLFHTRSADYTITTPDGSPAQTHHVIEIQSDWAQERQRLPVKLEPLSDAELLEEFRLGREFARLGEERQRLLNQMSPGLSRDNPLEYDRLVAELDALADRSDEISVELDDYYERAKGNDRQKFDQQFPAPFVKDENDWVDAGVRQNLLDAVTKDSEYITFGNGRQANQHINMPREAAERFYDRQVPRSVERVLKKFARDAGVEVPEIQRLPFVDGDEVIGFRLTPEFREAVRRVGLPSFRRGGLVSLLPV
jgi:hypothetical protein